MKIRKFEDQDAAAVSRLHRQTIRNINSKDYTQKQIEVWSARSSAERMRRNKTAKNRYVSVEDDKIIGFCDYSDDGELHGLYIHKDFLGKGVGKKLATKIESEARKKGIKKMFLDSTITAMPFYKKIGYKVIKEDVCVIGVEKLKIYKMKKAI